VVTIVKGDIFKSPAQALTNAVNCVGVMGKGMALEFKNRYPQMFSDYKLKCDQGKVKPGQPYLWEDDSVQILNFPTKRHWRDGSLLEDVEDGLKYLAGSYEQMGLQSIAMPALGCGLGGLKWSEVQPLIVKHLGSIPDLDVYVYEPQGAVAIRSDVDDSVSDVQVNVDKVSARPREL
jgi:O-acetyl-ADP-ribose deacetylase (regulator of RNase III)